VTLFRDPDVKFGSDKVGGIRISHASDIKGDVKIALTVSKARRIEFVVHPLKDAPKIEQAAPAQTSAPTTTKELTPNQKNYIKIRDAIGAADNEGVLFDIWNSPEFGYPNEIELIRNASQAKHDELLKMYDDKKASFTA